MESQQAKTKKKVEGLEVGINQNRRVVDEKLFYFSMLTFHERRFFFDLGMLVQRQHNLRGRIGDSTPSVVAQLSSRKDNLELNGVYSIFLRKNA